MLGLFYIEHRFLALDMRLCRRTAQAILPERKCLSGSMASCRTSAPMPNSWKSLRANDHWFRDRPREASGSCIPAMCSLREAVGQDMIALA